MGGSCRRQGKNPYSREKTVYCKGHNPKVDMSSIYICKSQEKGCGLDIKGQRGVRHKAVLHTSAKAQCSWGVSAGPSGKSKCKGFQL